MWLYHSLTPSSQSPSSPPSCLNSSHHWHIINNTGLVAQVPEVYESFPKPGRMKDKSPGGGRLELLSPLTPELIWGETLLLGLSITLSRWPEFICAAPHHHKIITLRNNFLLDAVQPKVNSRLADFENSEGCHCTVALLLLLLMPPLFILLFSL